MLNFEYDLQALRGIDRTESFNEDDYRGWRRALYDRKEDDFVRKSKPTTPWTGAKCLA